MARYLCKLALRYSCFLEYKQSEIAAACLILALNVTEMSGSDSDQGQFEKETCGSSSDAFMSDISSSVEPSICVLSKWTNSIVAITGMSRGGEIRSAYTSLVSTLQEQEFMSQEAFRF